MLSVNSTARVRSATTDPHTNGQARSGASPCGTRRSDPTTIFSNPAPACSNATPRRITVAPSSDQIEIPILAPRLPANSLRRTASSERELGPDELDGRIMRKQSSFELRIFDGIENLAEPRSRSVSRGNQVVTGDQCRRTNLFRRNFAEFLTDKLISAQIPMTRQAVRAM